MPTIKARNQPSQLAFAQKKTSRPNIAPITQHQVLQLLFVEAITSDPLCITVYATLLSRGFVRLA